MRHRAFFLKSVSTLKTSFGAKPNVLQFCPLSDFYVVSVMRIIMYVAISFVLNYKEIRNNYRSGRVASWHSSVFRYTYSINKRNVIMKVTPWLKLYYPLAKRWVYSIRNSCPSVRSFVRPFDPIDKNRKTKIIDSNRVTHIYRDKQTNR